MHPTNEGAIHGADIQAFQEAFAANPRNTLAMNAVTRSGIGPVAIRREVLARTDHTYSHWIQTPEATNQKASGRCWLFAGLNTLRLKAMQRLGLESFELSQAYLMFWDKVEKANYFYENILATLDEPLDGRLLMWLLAQPLSDAGQWDMLVNLIEKYGVVPKAVMPESFSSSASAHMNGVLTARLRADARQLRAMAADGATVDDLRVAKAEMMSRFYGMVVIHLGPPPMQFHWEWRDKDEVFHRHGEITPQAFFRTYVGVDFADYVCLINAPTDDKPFNRLYTVQYLGNIVGGYPVRYLNVPVDVIKRAAAQSIAEGEAVWFGADVGKQWAREEGILHDALYDYGLVIGIPDGLDKAARLDYGESKMNHAMVFTGVDIDDDGNPTKWRVENSGGTEMGDKGFMTMSDGWFSEYLYEVVVHRRYLDDQVLAVLEQEPIVLPPWDPMGALA